MDCENNKEIFLLTANMRIVSGAEAGARIGIELANGREPVCVGGLLQGKVYLQVNKEKVAAQSLVLHFAGSENTCTVHIASQHGSATLFKFETIIAQFPTGELTQGR